MKKFWIVKIVLFGAFALLALGLLVMLLWNWLVPVLFKGVPINLWQAMGLLVLSRILFGGFGGGGWGHGSHHRKSTWREKFNQKWSGMTPEEKERFKHSFGRCRKFHQQKEQEVMA